MKQSNNPLNQVEVSIRSLIPLRKFQCIIIIIMIKKKQNSQKQLTTTPPISTPPSSTTTSALPPPTAAYPAWGQMWNPTYPQLNLLPININSKLPRRWFTPSTGKCSRDMNSPVDCNKYNMWQVYWEIWPASPDDVQFNINKFSHM